MASDTVKTQRDYKEKHKKSRKRLKKIKALFYFFLISIAAVILAFLYCPGLSGTAEPDLPGLFGSLIPALATALLSTVFVNIICDIAWGEDASNEISAHIASTLAGNVDLLSEFTPEVRRHFITNTISTLTGREDSEMISGFLNPYLTGKYNTRRNQSYHIHVLPSLTGRAAPGIRFSAEKYVSVEEHLQYTKHYAQRIVPAEENHFPQKFYIYFCLRPEDTHEMHNDPLCMFRENLLLAKTDADALSGLSDSDKRKFVEEYMDLRLTVREPDRDIGELRPAQVQIDNSGIRIDYGLESPVTATDMLFCLCFTMPCLREPSQFIIQFGEPVFGVDIAFAYPDGSRMRPSLLMTGSRVIHSGDAVQSQASWTMQLPDQWIYPMSGIVFLLELPDKSGAAPPQNTAAP